MRVAIVVDDWKLDTFKERLLSKGFSFSDEGVFTTGCHTLIVDTETIERLKSVIHEVNCECMSRKYHGH